MFKPCSLLSRVLQEVSLGSKKLSYAISDGIGPHYLEKHLQSARQSSGFCLALVSASTRRNELSEELDLHLSFWGKAKGQVVNHLLQIIEMTSEKVEILKRTILSRLEEAGLSLKNILAISRDNPNVNKSLVKLLKEEVRKEGSTLLDFGACVLHSAHNSFKKGLSELSVDVSILAKSLHGFFKYSSICRESFAYELINLELEPKNFLQHVDSRWLTLHPAAERIVANFDTIESYFVHSLPELAKKGDSNAKEALKTKYYSLILEQLEKQDCRTVLKFVIFICQKFTPFLRSLQLSEPQIHALYDKCSSLLFEVASTFIESEHLPTSSSDGQELLKVDFKNKGIRKFEPSMSPSGREQFQKLKSSTRAGNSVAKKSCKMQ
jgi:hypothetical protein